MTTKEMDIRAAYIETIKNRINDRTGAQKASVTDVVINVYGKPYNTAVTLYSLLKESGQWIDKIYFIEERKQPHDAEFDFIKEAFANKLVCYTPKLWLWVRPFRNRWVFEWQAFRKSVRYQWGWEQTNKDFLFITHNDVLYRKDLVGEMLSSAGDNIGIGPVGQCWNCSAHFAGLCTPDTYTNYRPNYTDLKALMKQHPGSREKDYGDVPTKDRPWPLPECRLNEWTALINMKVARSVTMPAGNAVPFGAFFGLDIGTRWFNDVLNMGYSVKNFDITGRADHAWAGSVRSGHAALLKEEEYHFSERVAREYLESELAQKGI
ncbi:MAG: hypothetical protein IAE95_12225 [Chitinophagaceae bacterium]|nr:hypothetical protein [Chitinophagaceae bacterium]